MAKSDSEGGPMGYFVDSLFRKDANATAPAVPDRRDALSASTAEQTSAEVARIFMNDMRTGTMPAEDIRYVGQVVALRTGLTQADAEQRVTETFARTTGDAAGGGNRGKRSRRYGAKGDRLCVAVALRLAARRGVRRQLRCHLRRTAARLLAACLISQPRRLSCARYSCFSSACLFRSSF